jgi:copper(I)-binding protein
MKKWCFLTGALLCSLSAISHAEIIAKSAYARETAPSATTSAVFVTLSNTDNSEVALISASSTAAGTVELHDMIKEGDVMKMRHIERIVIPANGNIDLQPGGLHVMLFDLTGPLKEGQSISVQLNFSNQQRLTLDAPIKKVMMGMKKMEH